MNGRLRPRHLETEKQRYTRLAGWGVGKLTPKLGNGSHQETESTTTDLTALKTRVQRGAKEALRTPPLPGASLFTREISNGLVLDAQD